MRKSKKLKIKRIITVVTVLLIILFGVLLIKERESIPPDKNNEQPNIDEPENNEPVNKKPSEDEETSVEPEKEPEKEPEEEPKEPEKNEPIEIPQQGITIQEPEKIDVLVNKNRTLPSDYVPEDLVKLSEVPTVLENPEVNQLRSVAYEALKELFNAANEEEGYKLYARSGYRSYNTQTSLYKSYVDSYGQKSADKYSAKPGQSEHQTGLSIDITCEEMNLKLDDTFVDTDEGHWVAENAHRFGYIIRYPKGKEDITGYMYEPWHIRYLGEDLATLVYESGLTLEEYFSE
jgi:D-alanyl-D-alanine carboxypeptidase